MKAATKSHLHLVSVANSANLVKPVLLISKKDHYIFSFKKRIGKIRISTTNTIGINKAYLMSEKGFSNLLNSFIKL